MRPSRRLPSLLDTRCTLCKGPCTARAQRVLMPLRWVGHLLAPRGARRALR